MKLTKIFSVVTCSALALVGAFMFTGCPDNLGSGDISVTEGGAKAYINATNESTSDFRRTVEQMSIVPRKEVTSTITFENQTSTSKDGVMGLIFDYHTKEDADLDTVYDFGVVSLKAEKGKMFVYISYYNNVGADFLSGDKENFCDKNGKVIGEKGCLATETQIIPTNGYFESLDAKYYEFDKEKGTVVSAVNVAVQSDGSFLVKIAKDVASLESTENNTYVKYEVPVTNTSIDSETATKFAFYANVYKGKTLKGTWNTSL